MKTNLKTIALTAMVAVVGMSACSKENDNKYDIDDGKTTNVSIVLSEASTRAVAAPVDEVAVDFTSGYVIFTNSLGVINKVTEITATAPSAADKEIGAKVGISDLKTADEGGEIKNVPASATKVYILGNVPAGVAAPVMTENISAVQNRVIAIASQSNDSGSVADVTLYGDGKTLEAHPTIADAKYALIDVNAIASRIEVGKVSYLNTQTEFITGFQIDGIYVNYYYPEMSLAGKVSTALINNAPDNNTEADAMYTTATGGVYNAETASVLCDFAAGGLGYSVTDISKSAANPDVDTDKNVWAYNVLAPLSADGAVTELEAPHVIIRLSGITTKDDGADNVYTTTQYLTVKEFRSAATGDIISSFAPGYIYFIKNLTFNESNLTDIPEEEPIVVYVEAKLMTWTRQEVIWGF